MKRLFIIGNGFDLAHGLPTSYNQFHDFLQELYPDVDEEWVEVPWSTTGHHGEEVYDDEEVVAFWTHVLSDTTGDDWSDFESALGRLNWDVIFEGIFPQFDKEGDRYIGREMQIAEDLVGQVVGCSHYLPELFSEWIATIPVGFPTKKLGLYTPSDNNLFLTFNYTRLLEIRYNIAPANICHIHGVQGEDLIFGHGEGRRFDDKMYSDYPGSEAGLEYIQDIFRKDTQGALKKHRSFFERLSEGISSIYSYGFSFGKVDEPYLQEICARVDTSDIVWYLDDYNTSKHEEYQQTIRKCGFLGRFNVFTFSQIPTIFQM